jgi:MoaA/NifB/PqqE/SkfB family radical SAM enzyme
MHLPWYLYFFTYYVKCYFFRKRIPLLAGFKITNQCNLRCVHCPFWKRTSPQMLTFDQVKSILETLLSLKEENHSSGGMVLLPFMMW